jgi:hypothetical protein
MTSPAGREHVSRYRALGEFDSLVRAAREAKRALKELREEEAKLNAQSLADDKKITASKQERAKAEKASADSAKKAVTDLNKSGEAGKAGEASGVQYSRGVGKGIESESRGGKNRQFVDAATKALTQAFANAGESSGITFTRSAGRSIDKESKGLSASPAFKRALKDMQDVAGSAGLDTGNRYVQGFATKIRDLNNVLSVLGMDKLELDVGIEDAQQSIKAVEFELTRLSHTTASPQVRIDTTRALTNLRAIQKLFRDEVAEDIVKDSERIRKELAKLDELPSGKAFKFWSLTALSDMSRVFEEADRGTSVFERLRKSVAGGAGGGGGNFFRSFISGFDEFSESSSNLLQKLSRVSGELYRMPGIIGVLVAAIPALVSGLGALGGGALGLSSGLGAALGVVAAFPGVAVAMISSISVLSTTFGGFSDVLKEAKKAQTEEAIAKEQSRLGTDKALTATQKYNLMLKDMLPATQKSTEAVVAFSEAWTDASDGIGEKFFKEIVDDVDDLNKLLPIAEDFLGDAATALGKVADKGLQMVTSGPWKKDFQTISKNNAVLIENMGFAGLSLAEAFKDIVIAAGPFSTWLTKALKEGAESFSDWAANARSNGTIAEFLGETKESLQSLWQIFKNLGNVVNSFFQSTVDEGQTYLRTLEDITGHWADVAKAQENANSPLRTWMVQIRPILTALGDLIADVARGIGGLASNQNNIQTMIDLLNSLRTDVLPPILEILQHLNDSGIAVTVVRALGSMLEAIATFLDSGATQALTVFVTVLASFFSILFKIASLPGVSDVLGAVAAGIAAVAAVSVVARFTGLFKLWDFFTWMTRNKGNLSGAFADAARGVAGLPTSGQTNLPANIPSTIGGIGSEVTGGGKEAEKQITKTGKAAEVAAPKVGIFSRAVAGIGSAGGTAAKGLSGFTDFLGGPWGIAIAGATLAIGVIVNDLQRQKREAQETKDAWLALAGAYDELKGGNTTGVEALAKTDEKFRDLLDVSQDYGISLADLSGALNGNEQATSRVNAILDAQADAYKTSYMEGRESQAVTNLNQLGLTRFRAELNNTANAQKAAAKVTEDNSALTRTYQERLAGLTQEQIDNATEAQRQGDIARTLSGALDTLSSSTSTATDKSRALSDIIKIETGEMERANEATEDWNKRILDLKDSLKANGDTLNVHTRAGLANRDALEEAAKATRDLYLEDIASGTPIDEATAKHKKRTDQLIKEAGKSKETKAEAKLLVDMYGKIPENVDTNLKTTGYTKVYEDLQRALWMQKALQQGISVDAASGIINKDLAEARRGSGGRGDGPGFATGGPVYGAGTKTSDSIRAWLSNGEFVQPTDAVEHYGMPLMEAIRTKKLDKTAIQEALPDSSRATFASGGAAHSANCAACASGGHKFAEGGSASWPYPVNVSKTKIDKDWVNQGGALGSGSGGGGWQWQMRVLRAAFPGLPLISGYRPGSRTLSGNRSYHSVGRAVDLPPRRDVAAWIRSNYGGRTKELITPYNDLNLHNGKPHRYTGAIWNQHNFAGGNAHDHWAFNQGGLVDVMKMLNMNTLAPRQSTSLPTVPRSLSPAASSVVNNSTDNARTFGDVIINNPQPERAGDSVRDALYRTTLLY